MGTFMNLSKVPSFTKNATGDKKGKAKAERPEMKSCSTVGPLSVGQPLTKKYSETVATSAKRNLSNYLKGCYRRFQ